MLSLKSLDNIEFDDRFLLIGDDDYQSYTIINFSSPAIDSWIKDNPISFNDKEGIKEYTDISSFFSMLAARIDHLKVSLEPDDDSEVEDYLILLLTRILADDEQGFLDFLLSNRSILQKKATGGIFQVTANEFEPPILCGLALNKGESISYDFDVSDDEIYSYIEDLLGEEGMFDLKKYTPKVFQKLYKEFGDFEDY